jgi:hypothetical protein
MKYIKLFEEIDFTLDKNKFVYLYRFTIDELDFYVRFLKSIKDKVYIRRYNVDTPQDTFKTGYGKKDAILRAVSDITIQFIKDVKPNCIVIPHIGMSFEEGDLNEPNKRAKMNYEYLKNISGYYVEYYNTLYKSGNKEKTMTYCFLSKNGYKPEIYLLIPENYKYKQVFIN